MVVADKNQASEAAADVTGFVLAGGRSSRMGEPKAFLEFDGKPLIEAALEKVRTVAAEVRVVGPREKFDCYGTVIEDIFPDRGPLGGIHAALVSAETELNLVLAVDMPFVPERLLRWLVEEARRSKALVTAPRAAGGNQPLCAVYHKDFAEAAQAALRQGRNKIDALFAECPVRLIEESELAQFEFPRGIFDNLNTREEYDRAKSRRD